MTLWEAIQSRHSVRQFTQQPLSAHQVRLLTEEIQRCNQAGGLHIRLVQDEPDAFSGWMPHYGKFRGVTNYLVLAGQKGPGLEEACGYYGEHLVLLAQQLGLNTCWVALTFQKKKVGRLLSPGEALPAVIALGYGATQGVPHVSKAMESRMTAQEPIPAWFIRGMEGALLAPTAMNQQKFHFTLTGETVTAQPGLGFYTKMDLGIAEYHFEVGAGRPCFHFPLVNQQTTGF
jgi:hypothetical protein